MHLNKFYVYVHRRASDNTIFYVGKGSGFRSTRTQNRNTWWKNVVAKHGLVVEMVITDMLEVDAFQLEKDLISFYEGHLVNLTAGGEGAKLTSEETRMKLRAARRKTVNETPDFSERQRRIANNHWSKPGNKDAASERMKEQWKDPELRKRRAEPHGAAMTKLWSDQTYRVKMTNTIKAKLSKKIKRSDGVIFDSVADAAKALGIGHGHISAAARGKHMDIHMSEKAYLGYLKAFTNHPHQWDAFVEFINDEIANQNRKLQQSDNIVDLHRAQGAVHILQRISKLKEMVNGDR
jgi:hypothetical protein